MKKRFEIGAVQDQTSEQSIGVARKLAREPVYDYTKDSLVQKVAARQYVSLEGRTRWSATNSV